MLSPSKLLRPSLVYESMFSLYVLCRSLKFQSLGLILYH
jgi:hypothetical protein